MSLNLKFFSLVRTLSTEDLLAFQKHLKKAHAEDTVTLNVFNYYKKIFLKQGPEERLDPSYAYRKVFGAAKQDEVLARKKVLNALSDLHLWLKDFLIAQKMQDDPFEAQLLWLHILQERGLTTESSKLAARIYEHTCNKPLSDLSACQQQITAGHNYKEQLVQDKNALDFQALADAAARIKQSADILSLRMACEILNDQKTRLIGAAPPERPVQPLFILYQRIFALLSTEKEEEFHQAVSLLKEHVGEISTGEMPTILRFLHNFAALKIRSGQDVEWGKQLHELNKIALQTGLFLPKGHMSPTNFCNIVNTACTAQEMGWADAFIAHYAHFLPEGEQDESIQLARAIIEFEQKKFQKSLQTLEELPFKYFQHVVRSKALRLKCLYELDPNNDAIFDHCLSFEVYLLRHHKPKTEFIEATLSFLRLFKLFMQRKISQKALLDKIEATPVLYFKAWLKIKAQDYRPR